MPTLTFIDCSAEIFISFPCLSFWMQTSKEDLLQADFEGALKFFRVQLPKRYRAAENARRLMEQACNIKVRPVSPKRSLTLLLLCTQGNWPLFKPSCESHGSRSKLTVSRFGLQCFLSQPLACMPLHFICLIHQNVHGQFTHYFSYEGKLVESWMSAMIKVICRSYRWSRKWIGWESENV